MEAAKIDDKRYERDVILAWIEGASKDLIEAAEVDSEMAQKVKDALEMMLMAPAGISSYDFMSQFQVSEQDLPAFNIARYKVLEPMKEMGFDAVREISALNEEIGDGIYSFDEFSEKYTDMVEKFAPFEIDDIMPTLEEFKERPEEYAEVWSKWLELQNWCITVGVDFDGSEAEEEWNKFLAGERAKFQSPFPTPSSYGPQLPAGKDGKLDISISLDVENAEVGNVKTKIDSGTAAGAAVAVGIDPWVSNMKGR